MAQRALQLFHDITDRVGERLREMTDWSESGRRTGQYVADLHTDEVAVALLHQAGYGVLSEESGRTGPVDQPVVVVDPLDGSTNASRGVPWYATALCLVDDDGPAAALVANHATGDRFTAIRGEGAWRDGVRLRPSTCTSVSEAIVGISGLPRGEYGWAQFRALGAAALDLCMVANGTLDAYVDMSPDAHGVWDYLAGALICRESGAVVVDAADRELTVVEHGARRTPVAAATPELIETLLAVRRLG